jgi:mannose-6-phosphate isomerase-like protein (cupin superfamily)
MLNKIDQPTQIRDRHVLNIIPINGTHEFEDTKITRWVIVNGGVESDTYNMKGVIACSVNTAFTVTGHGVVIETLGVRMPENRFSTVNPNTQGHLSYIDGCSNTNLIDPPRNGDPCLNYLYFPSGIDQTFHTHPSIRIGYILSGSGIASMKDEDIPLEAGNLFILDRHALHRFRTTAENTMSLAVFHPDSEDGPRDEHNPMKTRTYLK